MPSNLRRAVKKFSALPVRDERTFKRIDEPDIKLNVLAMFERNRLTATNQGLPAIGSKLVNPNGLEFVVEGHVHVPTASTIQDWRIGKAGSPKHLYPSVVPQNLGAKLLSFIESVDRCTTKTLLVLDTMPLLRRDSGVPGGHWIDTLGNPGANLLFIDAASIHETHFAHEIGHLWVQYVDQAEDERVLRNLSDPARTNQFSFIQSFVIDFRVNEIIESKGFDMSIIREDQTESIASLGKAIAAGYRPESKREATFMSLTLATQIVESNLGRANLLASVDNTIQRAKEHCPELYDLAARFADAIKTNGFSDKSSIRQSIDECLAVAFHFTDGGIDLEHDLEVPPVQEPDFDKYPHWLENAPTTFKCEVGRLVARENIPIESDLILIQGQDDSCSVTFKTSVGAMIGTWNLNHPFPDPPPFNHREHLQRINEINQRNRERQMKQQSLPHDLIANMPGQSRRFYMAGTGRFLTRVREEEWLNGESAYGYAFENPVSYTDPSGNAPCHDDLSFCHTLTEAQLCALKGDHSDVGAAWPLCCDGREVICHAKSPYMQPPGFRICYDAHEREHFKQYPCKKGQFNLVFVHPRDECMPSSNEINCLNGQRKIDCSKGDNMTRDYCRRQYHDKICTLFNFMVAKGCSFLNVLCAGCFTKK